jgi:hypothetical protein
MRKLTFI